MLFLSTCSVYIPVWSKGSVQDNRVQNKVSTMQCLHHIAHYTLFTNNGENCRNDKTHAKCEWFVESDLSWFVSISRKTFSWNTFTWIGCLHKLLFFTVVRGVFSFHKNCCRWWIVWRRVFIMFCETIFFVKKWFYWCLQTATNSVYWTYGE